MLVQPCATHTTLLTHAHAHHLQARIKSLKAKEQQQQAPNIAFTVARGKSQGNMGNTVVVCTFDDSMRYGARAFVEISSLFCAVVV